MCICAMPVPADSLGPRRLSEGFFIREDGKMCLEPEPSYRRWTTSCVQTCDQAQQCSSERVPGLRDVLTAVGLASYIGIAEAWCDEMGAADLEELVEDSEPLVDDMATVIGFPGISRSGKLKQAIIDRVRPASQEPRAISWNSFTSLEQQRDQEDSQDSEASDWMCDDAASQGSSGMW